MTNNHLFSKHQFGFMKGKSCPLQLLEVLEDWTNALDNGNELDILFYDFRKAFDTLPIVKLFADDTKTYNVVNCKADHELIQRTTDQFSDWSHTWDLEFNSKKCK